MEGGREALLACILRGVRVGEWVEQHVGGGKDRGRGNSL